MFDPVFGSSLLAPGEALTEAPLPAIAAQGIGSFDQVESSSGAVADFSGDGLTSISPSGGGLPGGSVTDLDSALALVLASSSVHGSAADSGAAGHHHRHGNSGIQPDFNSGDLYVTSFNNASVLDYDVNTGMGTVVQSAGGLSGPCDMVFAPDGGLYIANRDNNTIGRIDPDTGDYTTFANGINGPTGLILSPDGGSLFVTAQFSYSILQYDLTTGQGSTFATNVGVNPSGMAISPDGTQMYVATADSILRYDLASGQGATFASGLQRPTDVAFGPDGSLFAAIGQSNAILQFDPATGNDTTFASGNGLSFPEDLVVSADGATLYSANYSNSTIFQFDLSSGAQSNFASGLPMDGSFGLAFAP
jgi:DNA-binding beta-propeller fold protein YncE